MLETRAGMIGSIPLESNVLRRGLLSYPLSAISLFGRFRGLPAFELLDTATESSVFSTSATSAQQEIVSGSIKKSPGLELLKTDDNAFLPLAGE